jgi:hypothetical protein
MNCPRVIVLALFMLAWLAAPAGPAQAETLFTAVIDQSQNVPPTGSPATGYASLILNDAQTEVDFAITYENLEGSEIAAHFHKAPPGENGSPVYYLPLGTPKMGRWAVTTQDVDDLFAGLVYVNIHTDVYMSGEIRGNISEDSTGFWQDPATKTWSRIKSLYR